MSISENVAYCRTMILHSPERNITLQGERLVGHIYEENGCYRTYYLDGSNLDNVARFICSCDKDKLICSSSDYAVLNTIGIYLDRHCLSDADYERLLELVISYQTYYEEKNVLPSFTTSDGQVSDLFIE